MSDNNKRIQFGSETFFQVGYETQIPADGNGYAIVRSTKNPNVAKFVKIEDGQATAYTGNEPIKVNGHDIELLIDNQLLQISPDGKLTVNLDEIGAELTEKLNIDITNISEAGKAKIIEIVGEAPEDFKDTVMIKDKIVTESGRTIAMSSKDTNVVTYGDDEAYLYFVSKQDLIHMKNGKAVAIVDSENFQEYTVDIMEDITNLQAASQDLQADLLEKADKSQALQGTAVTITTLATNAELATAVQKINEIIATLENRGVTKAAGS